LDSYFTGGPGRGGNRDQALTNRTVYMGDDSVANEPHTGCARTWASITDEIHNLSLTVEQVQAHDRDALERQIVALQDGLMAMAAPSLLAVAEKLRILWSEKLGEDQDGRERRLILDDIHRLVGVSA